MRSSGRGAFDVMLSWLKDGVSLLVYLLRRPFAGKRPVVLVYHRIDRVPARADPWKLCVAPELFTRHMAFLKKEAVPCLVTFDDGYESVLTRAHPVLKEHGMPAAFFVVTDFIDGRLSMDRFFGPGHAPRALSWTQVRELVAFGLEVGSHSVTHRRLALLDEAQARAEAGLSKSRIEAMTSCAVRAFSYPFGDQRSLDEKTTAIVRQAGYEKAYTNILGPDNTAADPFRVHRVRIYTDDNILRFRLKVAGAYDWVERLAPLAAPFLPFLERLREERSLERPPAGA